MSDIDTEGVPVIYGEVLFDTFEDGTQVLGGAPFNVAWHLQGFGLNPLFVSRIGHDDAGERVLTSMTRWGMSLNGIQHDPNHPTGTVQITLSDGQPSYAIVPDQAYDFIAADPAANTASTQGIALLYHGSLINRGTTSRQALERLGNLPNRGRFVDVNLRAPWWDRETVLSSVHGARWVKLNDEELHALGDPYLPLAEAAQKFREHHDIHWLIVTQGAKGALLLTAGNTFSGEPPPIPEIKDTVGAGDAFSAVTIVGLLSGWTPQTILSRALEFAATLCTLRGATPHDSELYKRHLRHWAEKPEPT